MKEETALPQLKLQSASEIKKSKQKLSERKRGDSFSRDDQLMLNFVNVTQNNHGSQKKISKTNSKKSFEAV